MWEKKHQQKKNKNQSYQKWRSNIQIKWNPEYESENESDMRKKLNTQKPFHLQIKTGNLIKK